MQRELGQSVLEGRVFCNRGSRKMPGIRLRYTSDIKAIACIVHVSAIHQQSGADPHMAVELYRYQGIYLLNVMRGSWSTWPGARFAYLPARHI